MAHNLCSINSSLPTEEQIYGLGFLTKAFGLWYANIAVLCGITQWMSPAIRLHTHFGEFEVLTAYTPVHSHARTMTYRMVTDPREAGLEAFQRRLETSGTRFYLNAREIRSQALDSAPQVYKPKFPKG